MVLVADQLPHVHRRCVVEALSCLPEQEGFGVYAGLLFGGVLGQNGFLGGLQDAIEAAKNREGQDDLAVVRLLVVAA